MDGVYDLTFGNRKMGTVQAQRRGLYYIFSCRCEQFTEQMYDVYLLQEGKPLRLGLLAPENGRLTLQAKIPVKQVGQGEPTFQLRPKHQPMPETFVPLHPQEPFSYLQKLENAYLANRSGQLGIVIRE